VKEVRC